VSVYLDASILVSFFAIDTLSSRAESVLKTQSGVIVSNFAAVEFASALARRVRMRLLTEQEARIAFSTFDAWADRTAILVNMDNTDISAAAAFLRRLDLTLRTQDALHVAMARRLDAAVLTFDKQMREAARVLGVNVSDV
jgi:predicted nucleic acid-binding protein